MKPDRAGRIGGSAQGQRTKHDSHLGGAIYTWEDCCFKMGSQNFAAEGGGPFLHAGGDELPLVFKSYGSTGAMVA